MLSCYLAAFNHPKPKHALSHLLARFRIGKHLAPSWRVAKRDAGVMTDIMWHVLRKWWHSDSVFGFGENIIRIPSIPVFPSCLTKSPLTPIAMGFSLFLPTSFVPKWEELQISRPPKFLVGVICIILCPLGFAVEVHVLKFSFNNRQKKLNMTAEMRSAHSTRASLVENQTLPVFGCRLNEHDMSASIFEDLYPMSAFLTIRGDNDTPCVCSSPFQRFSNEVLRSTRTICVGRGRCDFNHFSLRAMPWRRLFCESRGRHIVMDLLHFGQLERYDGFSALPLTAINWPSSIPDT